MDSYLTSTTNFSFPTKEANSCSLSSENFAPGKRKEVTMTYAQAGSQFDTTKDWGEPDFAGACV